ncbi:MAG TPA: hypothetical protein EYP86_04475 [Candidatus Altiarchaeales archaeon]|nr:hypothetical protein [Candidatus Altiarchaeales archaeon]
MNEDFIDYRLERVGQFAQLAAILEVISFKVGNVNPMYEFHDTKFEDFILGSIAIAPAIRNSTLNGFRAGKGEISLKDIGIGENIRKAVVDIRRSHSGGNTHLGMVMLMVPIAASAGISFPCNKFILSELRKNIVEIISNSTVNDTLQLYEAIKISGTKTLGRLKTPRVPFYELMKISSRSDRNAEELSNGMRIILNEGYPYIEKFYKKTGSFRDAIAMAHLNILSKYPDTFIARKAGMDKAEYVSRRARDVLDYGGIMSEDGRREMEEFDNELRRDDNLLNPGSTADIVAASLFVYFLLKF